MLFQSFFYKNYYTVNIQHFLKISSNLQKQMCIYDWPGLLCDLSDGLTATADDSTHHVWLN